MSVFPSSHAVPHPIPSHPKFVCSADGTVQSEYLARSRMCRKDAGAEPLSASTSAPPSPLLSFEWERVILDEAHCVRNPQTAVSRACCSLISHRRWCVTGTPVQNSLGDVYGLLKFLRHEPWCEAGFWRRAVTDTIISKEADGGGRDGDRDGTPGTSDRVAVNRGDGGLQVALGRVRRILTPLMLRRTKDTLTSDG